MRISSVCFLRFMRDQGGYASEIFTVLRDRAVRSEACDRVYLGNLWLNLCKRSLQESFEGYLIVARGGTTLDAGACAI